MMIVLASLIVVVGVISLVYLAHIDETNNEHDN